MANAFDTNYYRRLNAEAMAQIPVRTTGAACAATATATEFAAESEAEFEAGVRGVSSEPDQLQDASPDQPGAEYSPALDLEIRPAVDGDSVLDRYCISEPEPDLPSRRQLRPRCRPHRPNKEI